MVYSLLGVDGRAVQREAGIALEVRSLACAGHRAEAELAVRELALDARDAWRAVGAQRPDRLVATGVEQLPHPPGELWLRLLDRAPRRNRRRIPAAQPAQRESPGRPVVDTTGSMLLGGFTSSSVRPRRGSGGVGA